MPLKLNHGLMEMGYVDHQTVTRLANISASEPHDCGQDLSVSMTATLDAMGNLVLGKICYLFSVYPYYLIYLYQLHGRQGTFYHMILNLS